MSRRDDDLVLAGLGAAALLLLGSKREGGLAPASSTLQWPLPTLLVRESQGPRSGQVTSYAPTISDGYHPNGKPRLHLGADLMYRRSRQWTTIRRLSTGILRRLWDERHFPAAPPYGSPGGWFFCGPDVQVRALAPGKLWHASLSARGFQVLVDHGSWVSYYQHLRRINVPVTQKGKALVDGKETLIDNARILGAVGADPMQGSQGINHLHLEAWTYRGAGTKEGASERVRWDPATLLTNARHWSVEVNEGRTTMEP